MKIRVPGYALFFILVTLLYTVITHARGIAPTAHGDNAIPADAVEVPAFEVERYLQVTAKLTRYRLPWFGRPRVFISRAWYVMRGCDDCGALGVTIPTGERYIFLHSSLTADPAHLRDVMVHELVHWLQFANGWDWDMRNCTDREAHEVEAYSTQYVFVTIIQKRPTDFRHPDFMCQGRPHDEPFGVVGPPIITRH